MRFDTSQQMRMGQQMKLAPRMIQSMEILQMPLAELEERIEQELASNPTLELAELEPDAEQRNGLGDEGEANPDGELDLGERDATDDFARLDEFETDNPHAAENAFDEDRPRETIDWRAEGSRSLSRLAGEPDARAEMMASAPDRGESLHEQLLKQWGVVDVVEFLRPLGAVLIGYLDDDGYLRTPLEEIAEKATKPSEVNGRGWPPAIDDLELALKAIQLLLEPAGVGARDARECLLLQLDAQLDLADGGLSGASDRDERLIAPSDTVRISRTLVESHFEDLMNNRLPKIAERSGLGLGEIREGIEALRRLSLAPARRLEQTRAEPVMPDVIVEYDEAEDRYIAYMNDARMPNLRINREYALLTRDEHMSTRDKDFIKTNLSNAQWLMDAVEQRRGTLLRVVNAVLVEQRDYLDHGPEALRPLPMTQVAERLGVHVATVSRAVSDKHLMTPRGVIALRSFFTGGLSTEGGEDLSYDAVKAALKEVIEQENKAKPLSDESIVKAMKERGIEIARRTVAKYRSQLGIPSARLRKQF